FLFRYSSLAALVAAVFAPALYVMAAGTLWYEERSITASIVAMAALLLWRHQQNIMRLIQGKESRLGSGKKDAAAAETTAAAPAAAKSKKAKQHHK
nr:glycerol-3-phosphate acyltransferase [Giesbergeria sp.]